MRSVVVDMQNLLFADVVAEALRHFNFEFKPAEKQIKKTYILYKKKVRNKRT